jgi:hypothetical protein
MPEWESDESGPMTSSPSLAAKKKRRRGETQSRECGGDFGSVVIIVSCSLWPVAEELTRCFELKLEISVGEHNYRIFG